MADSQSVTRPYRILGISGSLRAGSYSTAILRALAEAMVSQALFEFADIGRIPLFNQDLCGEPLPLPVAVLREQVTAAEGLVIVSPEYGHGIPGVLKNAFDWVSRPHNRSPFRHKLVLVVTSSHAFTGGVRAQHQVRESLVAALAKPVATPEIVIGLVHDKMVDGRFEDPASVEFARVGFEAMFEAIDRQRAITEQSPGAALEGNGE